eukprot:c20148_g1_i3 orf=111-371(+)
MMLCLPISKSCSSSAHQALSKFHNSNPKPPYLICLPSMVGLTPQSFVAFSQSALDLAYDISSSHPKQPFLSQLFLQSCHELSLQTQ